MTTLASWAEQFAGPQRQLYRTELVALATADRRIVCLDSDTGGLETTFGRAHPDRYINLGIAEANMLGVAAGLAHLGKIPFVNAISSFALARACEQLKVDVAGNGLPVKVVVTHGGVSAGHYGPTHHATEDLAIAQSLPGLTVLVPADGYETVAALRAAAATDGPVLIRLGRTATPPVNQAPYDFTIGRAVELARGSDVTLVATGPWPVLMALEAASVLAHERATAQVLNLHTVKPLDEEAILRAVADTGAIVTVEDHTLAGGVGSAVAGVVAERHPCPLRRVALADRVHDSVGEERELLEAGGVSVQRIVDAAKAVLRCRR